MGGTPIASECSVIPNQVGASSEPGGFGPGPEKLGQRVHALGQSQGLTEALWGIRWAELLPRQVATDVVVVASCFDEALPFIDANFTAIFRDTGTDRFFTGAAASAKAWYYRIVGDFFEFKQGGRTVAFLIGGAADWSTYSIRMSGALPEVQGKQLIPRFLADMFVVLKDAGIERVETETSSSNIATLHLLSRLRFNPSGTVLSERWGAMMKFTRFLDDHAERVFIDQFCTGVHYQLRTHPGSQRASSKGERP